MAVTYGFYNALNHDRLYDAIQMSSIFDGIIRDGIFSTIGDTMIVTSPEDEKEVLKELIDSYLYKDIMEENNIAKPDKLVKLVQALAFQIGSTVSANELAGLVGIDAETVERYIEILEKN